MCLLVSLPVLFEVVQHKPPLFAHNRLRTTTNSGRLRSAFKHVKYVGIGFVTLDAFRNERRQIAADQISVGYGGEQQHLENAREDSGVEAFDWFGFAVRMPEGSLVVDGVVEVVRTFEPAAIESIVDKAVDVDVDRESV